MKRIIIGVIVFLVVGGAVYGYSLYQKKTPDVVNVKPEVVIDAAGLLQAFESDTAAARELYVDKIVQVTGRVKKIDPTGTLILGEEGSVSDIAIGFDRRHIEDAKNIKLGEVATLQGICTGGSNASTDPTDLLAALGTTVELRSAGVKKK
jgi:hypothetical protein